MFFDILVYTFYICEKTRSVFVFIAVCDSARHGGWLNENIPVMRRIAVLLNATPLRGVFYGITVPCRTRAVPFRTRARARVRALSHTAINTETLRVSWAK